MNPLLLRSAIAVLLSALVFPLYAGEGKASISLASNYIFRGSSLSMNDFVMQGGYEYDYGTSLLAGVWFSTLPDDFEYDIYARYSDERGDLGYSAGFIYYGFTDSTVPPAELNLAVSYFGFSIMTSAGVGVNYTETAYETELSDIAIRLHYGTDGTDTDHSLIVSKQMGGMDIGLVYASKQDGISSISTDAYALTIGKDF